MVAPIIGPTTTEIGLVTNGPSMLYERIIGYKQSKPFDLPLPYLRIISKILSIRGSATPGYDAFSNAGYSGTYDDCVCNFYTIANLARTSTNNLTRTVNRAKNQVYEEVVSQLSDKVELLVSLAERRQAYSMMTQRLQDLYRFLKALRHPNPRQMRQFFTGSALPQPFKNTLNNKLRNWRKSTNDVGQTWLELHFGWEPIVRDIDTLCQLMSEPIPEVSVKVMSSRLAYGFDQAVERTYPWSKTTSHAAGSVRAYGTVTLQVDNLDQAYASVLGINNPVLTAYSLIPFTWMFDWVNYLGSYISQFTDLAGYVVLNASHSWKCTIAGVSKYEYPSGTIQRKNSWSGVWFERQTGIPNVTLDWRPLPKRLSPIRGTTLASLLATKFDPKNRRGG